MLREPTVKNNLKRNYIRHQCQFRNQYHQASHRSDSVCNNNFFFSLNILICSIFCIFCVYNICSVRLLKQCNKCYHVF